jgi:site-specific DNA-adenine methylase
MFSYYGSKSQIVDYYPRPKYWKIIEPFAGSARYSLKWFENDVLLVDKYEVVVRIWKWLQKCSVNDIMSLPKLSKGMDLRHSDLSEDEMLFLGMCAGISSTTPRFKISGFAGEQNGRKNRFKRIADQLYKIRHWEIRLDSYENLENETATWFIDPPYQFGGHAYKENKIDFSYLAEWCKERNGQVLVCENSKADWMDFKPMVDFRGANNKFSTEVIWSNIKTSYDIIQQPLF